MLDRSAAWDDALIGSVQPVVQVDAWYDNELVREDLPGVSGTVSSDATRLVVTSAQVTAAASDGSLTPSSWDSPLGCYGTELHVRAGIRLPGGGVELKSLGWFRIDTSDSTEQWQPYRRKTNSIFDPLYPGFDTYPADDLFPSGAGMAAPSGPEKWLPRGSIVPVSCSDRMAVLDEAQFLAPEQPASLASVTAEIQRLCQGIIPIADLASVIDKPIPRNLTYTQSRSGAVQLLAGVLGLNARADTDGALELVPVTAVGEPVWKVTVGSDAFPPIASWTRHLDRATFFNAVVSTGQTAAGAAVQGIALETVGPLRYGGPFGRVPYFKSSPLLNSNSDALADAQKTLAEQIAQRTVVIPVVVPSNPALEPNDIMAAQLPDQLLTGPAVTIERVLGVQMMTVGIAVPRSDLWS